MRHLSPDVSELIFDPDMGAQKYTVFRKSGDWQDAGRFEDVAETPIVMTGLIQPTANRDLQSLPEGDRITGMMTFYAREMIYMTRADGTSDEIEWRGQRYTVVATKPWVDHGFIKAFAVLMGGE